MRRAVGKENFLSDPFVSRVIQVSRDASISLALQFFAETRLLAIWEKDEILHDVFSTTKSQFNTSRVRCLYYNDHS